MGLDSKKLYLAILLSVGTLIFLFNLGGRDLWDPDETRYAVVAREMRESGNWILPQLNGKIYAEKPPLFFWLVNLSVFFLGEDTEFANRLPSALAGVLTMILTFLFGKKLFNERAGFFSAMILSTCFLFPQLSRWMLMDSLFTLFFTLTLFYFYLGHEDEEGRPKYYLLAGFFTALATLTKGPIAFLPTIILLLYSFVQKEPQKARNLFYSFMISIALILIWLLPACWAGGETYKDRLLFGQTLGRFIEGGKHFHAQSFFFYFIRFPLEFFPWTVFLPTVFVFALKNGKNKSRRFLFVWFITVFLFFTLSRGKKDNYILPLYPAAALLVGSLFDFELDSNAGDKRILVSLIVLIFLFLAVFFSALIGLQDRLYPGIEAYRRLGLFILSYVLVGSLLSALFLIKRKKWASFVVLAGTFTFFHLHLSYAIPLRLNEQRSMKIFSGRILKRMGPQDELKVCLFRPTGLYYYTKRPFTEEIWSQDRFYRVFQSFDRVFMVVQKSDLDRLKKDSRIQIFYVDQMKVWHWDMVLISNR